MSEQNIHDYDHPKFVVDDTEEAREKHFSDLVESGNERGRAAAALGGQTQFLQCRISRGGFPSEAVYHIDDADGNYHSGLADIKYVIYPYGCGVPITPVKGYVLTRVLRREGPFVLLELPDRHHCIVEAGSLEVPIEDYGYIKQRLAKM